MQLPQTCTFRYLRPEQSVYLIARYHKNHKLNEAFTQYYSVPFNGNNALLAFMERDECMNALKQVKNSHKVKHIHPPECIQVSNKHGEEIAVFLRMPYIVVMNINKEECEVHFRSKL